MPKGPLIDKSIAFPDTRIGVRLDDRHVVCYICKRQSEPQRSMQAATAIMLAHDHDNPQSTLPKRWNGE
jgi:hypothetical protein